MERRAFAIVTTGLCLACACPWLGCAALAEDDGFRAKVLAGCRTAEECQALYEQADARREACLRGSRSEDDCRDAIEQRREAERLREAQAETEFERSREQSLADQQAAQKESEQFRADAARLGSACEDIAALEVAGKAAREPAVVEQYAAEAKNRREQRARALLGEIAAHTRKTAVDRRPKVMIAGVQAAYYDKTPALTSASDPGAFRKEIASTKALAQDLRCYDADAATKASSDIGTWASEWEAAIANEEKCRATPQCLADRLTKPVCEAIADRREALAGIARENRNPSGYVDRRVLHDLGQEAQEDEETIRALRARYVALVHKPFADVRCPKTQ